jgi:hypothetical protein
VTLAARRPRSAQVSRPRRGPDRRSPKEPSVRPCLAAARSGAGKASALSAPVRCRLHVFLAVVVCSRQWNNAKERRAQRPSWCYWTEFEVYGASPARRRCDRLPAVAHYSSEHLESPGRGRPSDKQTRITPDNAQSSPLPDPHVSGKRGLASLGERVKIATRYRPRPPLCDPPLASSPHTSDVCRPPP